MSNTYFDNVIMILILISTITLALDNPLDNPVSTKQRILTIITNVLTALFTLEAIIKIIVFGFINNGKKSYLRSGWNIIDLFVILIAYISIKQENSQFYKVLRLFRLLRPLRFIKSNPGMRIAVQSLIHAIPGIFNLTLISLMTISLFAILGVNFFKGTFYTCKLNNVPKDV